MFVCENLKENRGRPHQIKSALLQEKWSKRGQCRSNCIVPNSDFIKRFEIEKDWRVIYKTYLFRVLKDNMGQTVLSLISIL